MLKNQIKNMARPLFYQLSPSMRSRVKKAYQIVRGIKLEQPSIIKNIGGGLSYLGTSVGLC